MKQLTFFIFAISTITGLSQSDRSWRIGGQLGFHGSHSYYTGGMEEADARFGNDDAGGGALEFLMRYDYNKHWMLTGGVGIQSFGFQFSLSQNYSLLRPESRLAMVHTEFSVLETPLMLHYKFNPNCRNARWVIGAGWAAGIIGAQASEATLPLGTEAATNTDFLKVNATANNTTYGMLRFSIARERVLKCGGIINVSLLLNAGSRELASSHVMYRINGKDYEHSFGNKGDFVGLRIAYFLRSFNTDHVNQ